MAPATSCSWLTSVWEKAVAVPSSSASRSPRASWTSAMILDVGDDDAGALGGEEPDGALADAARPAGHNGDLAFEPAHRSASWKFVCGV
jgi:hypothetical protein